ncbi:MAG: dihydrodipicolinate synthase family protein [Anaerolineae bacterium]
MSMELDEIREILAENVVAVPTTIWKEADVLDLEGNARNATYLFEHGVTAAVYAGGTGEHDRLTVEQQVRLLQSVTEAARKANETICVGTGLGRTLERVRALAPVLGELGVDAAMLMPASVSELEAQYDYYGQAIRILREHGVWSILYARPEYPLSVELFRRLFADYAIPGVKLANNNLLLSYAEMVHDYGHKDCAWLCGVAGWWMPAYHAVGAARGMSSGIVNAFPERPRALLRRILSGEFERSEEYWTIVRLEQLRRAGPGYVQLVIKYMQELVGLAGGMNGDGAQLPEEVKRQVDCTLQEADWLA